MKELRKLCERMLNWPHLITINFEPVNHVLYWVLTPVAEGYAKYRERLAIVHPKSMLYALNVQSKDISIDSVLSIRGDLKPDGTARALFMELLILESVLLQLLGNVIVTEEYVNLEDFRVDDSTCRAVYAAICMIRGRLLEEALLLIDEIDG